MLLGNVASSSSASHSTIFFSSFHRCPSIRARSGFLTALRARSASAENDYDSLENREQVPAPASSYAGVKLLETVDVAKSGKLRLDAWISSRIQGVSRARVQSSIRSGLVSVNGRVVDKVSHNVRAGDMVDCTISELQPLRAEPEDIPVDIVYEDEHVLVVNKPAHMVVHPAPGNASGTLVNAILHHCSLPTVGFSETELSEGEEVSDNESSSSIACETSTKGFNSSECGGSVRPGIVHRLDKGTSGLLVVAKNEHSHVHLSEQFKRHTIQRVYISLTSGVPSATSGRIEVPIGRDTNNRIRMAAIPGPINGVQARYAASLTSIKFYRYKVIEVLAGGSSALVEWRLETGRTHQIRAHAKYVGIPLFGDEVYGGTKNMILSLLQAKLPPGRQSHLPELVSKLERPCLHAFSLGFIHPRTGKNVQFSCQPPEDFSQILCQLRKLGMTKHTLKA
ncbi:RNA pseudouridine synthase 2, chloroplastic isoform X2 [Rhodamnia argentea]|uniref:RNA pseudouridine synthase 2, chloroplastic isoform X2 n=1 Tax=Rhodamnia argentea TaxID=178133 RepID=A0ABM3GZU5_9MYRT|nr:RNA pseudouridine synthase 2, chloroplastic isoform X2 [Rhodamnia argentea]